MRQHYLRMVLGLATVLVLGASIVGCDSANPVAPTGSTLTVTASPTQISLSSDGSLITVTGFKPDGNPLNPGSQVNLATDLGVLDATVVEIGDNGRASTRLRPDGRPGTATVTASLTAGDAMAMAAVQIGEDGIQPTLAITASPNRINIEQESTISVIARNVDGSFLSGGRVRLRSTLGQLDDENVVTNAAGEAETTLRPSGRSGTADVSGSVESSMEATTQVTIIQTQLILTANPGTIDINDLDPAMDTGAPLDTAEITVQVRDEDSILLVERHDVELTSTLGLLLRGSVNPVTLAAARGASSTLTVTTGIDGKATATYVAGERAGTDTVTALLGNAQAGTSSITLRDAPANVTLDVDPVEFTPDTDGTDFALTVRVSNAEGEPLVNEIVRFEVAPDTVGFTIDPPGGPTTNGAGLATATMTITASGLPPGVQELRVTAFVRSVRSNTVPIKVLGTLP